MQLPLEELGLSFNSRKIEARSVTHFDVNAHVARSTLDGELRNTLAMIAFQALGESQHPRKETGGFALLARERSVGGMGGVRLGFAVVVAHQGGGHVLLPPAQARNFRVVNQIFAVAVVRLAVHQHAAIVKHGCRSQNGARLRIQVWYGQSWSKSCNASSRTCP